MNLEAVLTIGGYEAEVIRLVAEKQGKSPEEVVLSFFGIGCNAPSGDGEQ